MTTINIVGNALSGSVGSTNFAGSTALTTWSPVFTFATLGNLSVSYATQAGAYEIVGNVYVATFSLQCTPTFTTSSGAMQITGLPVASNSAANNNAVGACYTNAVTFPALTTYLTITIPAGTAYVELVACGSTQSSTTFSTTNFTTGVAVAFFGTIMYLV